MAAHVITSFLLDEIYLILEIRIWLNDNFILFFDYMSDLVPQSVFEVASTIISSLQTKQHITTYINI